MKMKRVVTFLLGVLMLLACLPGCFGNTGQSAAGPNADPAAPDAGKPALNFPVESVNCIVPYSAGGGTDLMVRAVAAEIDLGRQTMVVTNIEGANALTGSYECFNADPDGYTLVSVAPEAWIAQYMSGALQDELYAELTPLCVVAEDANVLAVASASSWQTFDDFVAYAKEAGTKCTVASTSKGGSNEFFAFGLADVAGYEFTYVPYDGGSKSRTAVLGGDNDAVICQVSEIKALVDSGDMRVLGVSSDERVSFFDAPTFKEQGYDIEFGLHRSIWTTGGVDEAVVSYLSDALQAACESPECSETLLGLGYTPAFSTSAELRDIIPAIVNDLTKWAGLVK